MTTVDTRTPAQQARDARLAAEGRLSRFLDRNPIDPEAPDQQVTQRVTRLQQAVETARQVEAILTRS